MDKLFSFKIEKDTVVKHFLRKTFSSTIAKRIKTDYGNICINNKPSIATDKLKKGDILTIFVKENSTPYKIKKDLKLQIVYNDEDILIVNKPKNVCSISVNGHEDTCIFAGLAHIFPNESFRIVTRLDKDTEGLMLITKNSIAHSILNESKIIKKYTALLEGLVSTNLTVNAPIKRVENSIKRCVSTSGAKAITKFKILKSIDDNTLVECELKTGKTHQIRVHSAFIGHPIVGDTLYGHGIGDFNSGQNLKCTYLEFDHPFTKKRLIFTIN